MAKYKAKAKEYIVVFRAPSAAIFRQNGYLEVKLPGPLGAITSIFRTRYPHNGSKNPLPGDMWIESRGHASSIKDAISQFGERVDFVLNEIAFCTNAAIGDLDAHLVFDNSPGITEREYFQTFIPDEKPKISRFRYIQVDLILEVLNKLVPHIERERIHRALTQYRLALDRWRWGHETLSTAHLYIGVETLSKSILRSTYSLSKHNTEIVAYKLGIDPDRIATSQHLNAVIESAVRKDVIFQGDEESYKGAKAASDGFEHGFMPFAQLREKAKKVRNLTAKYLRESVLDLLDVENQVREKLIEKPYNEPIGNWKTVIYLRGKLVGNTDTLATPENQYPILRWERTITEVKLVGNYEYNVSFNMKWAEELAEGVTFQPDRLEVWAP